MKINLKKVVAIMICIIVFEIVYFIGFYASNKIAYGNSEDEIAAEFLNSESENENEDEDVIEDSESTPSDLTDSEDDDIIIIEDEDTEPTLEDILIAECPFKVIDEIYEIDAYEEGNWYCYYLFCDGDVYVVTLKNGHVDVCCQLN